jgi:hypothetical protein
LKEIFDMSDLIPKGNYSFKGYGVPELGSSPEKNTPFVHVAVQIVGGEYEGRIVARDLFFTEKTTQRTMDALKALGCTFPGNAIDDFTGYGSTTTTGTVEHETYTKDGVEKTVAKIGFINNNFGVSAAARMDEAQKAAFRAKMMGTVAASAGPKAVSNGPAASKAPF